MLSGGERVVIDTQFSKVLVHKTSCFILLGSKAYKKEKICRDVDVWRGGKGR